jgi:Dodecin
VATAATTVRDLRVADVLRQDVTIKDCSIVNYPVRLGISFKYEPAIDRWAFATSPVLASLDSVVETVGRASPALVATWPAVIALPPASAASTDALVAPRVVRPLPGVDSAVRRLLAVGVAVAAGWDFVARVWLRPRALRTDWSTSTTMPDATVGRHA